MTQISSRHAGMDASETVGATILPHPSDTPGGLSRSPDLQYGCANCGEPVISPGVRCARCRSDLDDLFTGAPLGGLDAGRPGIRLAHPGGHEIRQLELQTVYCQRCRRPLHRADERVSELCDSCADQEADLEADYERGFLDTDEDDGE